MHKIIFHNADLDGKCSAAIVGMWCREHGYEYEYVGCNYGYSVPFWAITEYDVVVIVDFSWEMALMAEIANRCTKLVWIDHHKTAIDEYKAKGYAINMEAYIGDEAAGCQRTWDYFFPNKKRPEAVDLLGWYDDWSWEKMPNSEDILAFQYGMRQESWWPNEVEEDWENLLVIGADVKETIHDGHVILKYQRGLMERITRYGRVLLIAGKKFFFCNTHHAASTDYDCVREDGICGVVSYRQKADGSWNYSIRAFDDTDVSEIVKEFGGGGHAGAGGWNGPLLDVLYNQ
jgi:oligoribonuclease NrnB/cAMP/cGMP phosphodiesterase (DHH superfamily)